jgi:hypothetical protein
MQTLLWFFVVVEIAARLARWTGIGVVLFYRARLVIRLSSVQSVACQAVKHAILCTRATIACAKLFCKACLYSSTCDECSKVLSEKCVHDGKERLIKYCEGCWSDVCGGRMPRSRECLCHML